MLSGVADQTTTYQIDGIELSGTDELTVDTTQGPVYLFAHGNVILRDTAKIRNIRTDGQTPQVGDLRIIQLDTFDNQIVLRDATCIEHAFLYSPEDDFQLLSTADGCPGESNSTVIGVIWTEDIINSTNSPTARSIDDGGDDFVFPTSFVTTGVEVPEDLSSLVDVLESANLPVYYSIESINSWSSVGI